MAACCFYFLIIPHAGWSTECESDASALQDAQFSAGTLLPAVTTSKDQDLDMSTRETRGITGPNLVARKAS